MFDQELPTYTHAFEKDLRWKVLETPHYIFRYFPNSEAAKDISVISDTQEKAYAKIMDFLKMSAPGKKIEYYLYPDAVTKIALMGDDWYAQSVYNEFRVHVLYTASDKPLGPHEDTHLLSLPWGLSIGFFQEGLAEFMIGHAWDGTPHAEYVKQGYSDGIFCPISELMTQEGWMRHTDKELIKWYSLAGVSVSFLISKFGKDRFESFYKATSRNNSADENEAAFMSAFGISIDEAEILIKKSVGLD